jgi:septal ring factor EnvC (AmiA/AmiB activator)
MEPRSWHRDQTYYRLILHTTLRCGSRGIFMAQNECQDARTRKRERDKQNQRLKRRRERTVLDELQQKNEDLEQEVKALRGGTSSIQQYLSDTAESLLATNKDLKSRLDLVNQFVRSWNASGEKTTPQDAINAHMVADVQTTFGVSPASSSAYSTPLASGKYRAACDSAVLHHALTREIIL